MHYHSGVLIDSHCHLADEAFEKDVLEVIQRAQEAGLTHALCILAAENTTEAKRAKELLKAWPACGSELACTRTKRASSPVESPRS